MLTVLPPIEKIAYLLKEAPLIHGMLPHVLVTNKFNQSAAKM